MQKKLSMLELVVYYIGVIITGGTSWLIKIVIKKAIIEANKPNESKKQAIQSEK